MTKVGPKALGYLHKEDSDILCHSAFIMNRELPCCVYHLTHTGEDQYQVHMSGSTYVK